MAKIMFRSGPYAGKALTLPTNKPIVMGRNRDIELPLPDPKLSRRHCQIALVGEKVVLKDLGSTNGTFVNGARISEVELKSFDRIVLGDIEIELLDFEDRLKAVSDASKTPVAAPAVGIPSAPAAPSAPAPAPEVVQEPLLDSLEEVSDAAPEPVPVPAAAVAPPVRPPSARASAPVPVPPPVLPDLDNAPIIEITGPKSGSGFLIPENARPMDPFEAALAELAFPLPPEPPPLAAAAAARPKVLFCDRCDSSIPDLDLDLGQAREHNGKFYCRQCATSLPASVAAAPVVPATTAAAAVKTRAAPPERSIDDVLAGLNEEAVVIDTTMTRRGQVVKEDQISKQLGQLERAKQQAMANRPALPPRVPARPQPVAPAKPPAPPRIDPDEELEEIK